MGNRRLKPATDRGIFFWNMAGSVCNAANSVLMIYIINKLSGVGMAGVYSIALAVSQVMSTIAYFEVRNFQVSDTVHEFSFSEYHLFRLITIAAAIIFAAVWAVCNGYAGTKLATVMLCCAFQCAEAYENVFQSQLQVKARLDLVGKSFALRVIADPALFWIILSVTGNFLIALSAYTTFAGIWILLVTIPWSNHYEKPHHVSAARLPSLMKACMPIFLTSFLMSYIVSAPKYALDTFYPYAYKLQAYFNMLLMPASIVNLFTLILYRIYIIKMAEDWNHGRRKKFCRRILLFLGWIVLLGSAVLILGWLFGIRALRWFYKLPELTDVRMELMVVLLGGIFAAAAEWFNVVLTIIRRQRMQLVVNFAAALICFFTVNPLVKNYGIMGASVSYLLSMAILFLLQVGILLYYLSRDKTEYTGL